MTGKRTRQMRQRAPTAADRAGTAVGELIRRQRRLARLSVRQLADVAKVSNAYISQIERGIYRPSAKVLNRLARALDVSAESLYAKAGLLDEDPDADVPRTEDAIRLDPGLTDEQRETLLRVYRSFVGSD